MRGHQQDIQSSLPLQVAVYFHRFYNAALFIVTLLMFIYKAVMLPYPKAAIGLEVAFVFVWGLVEVCRLYLGACGGVGGGKRKQRTVCSAGPRGPHASCACSCFQVALAAAVCTECNLML